MKSVDYPECIRPPSNLRRKKRIAVNTLYLLLRIDPCCMDTVHHPTSLILFTRRERTSAINSKIVNTPQKKLDFHIIVNKSRRPDKRATMYFSFFLLHRLVTLSSFSSSHYLTVYLIPHNCNTCNRQGLKLMRKKTSFLRSLHLVVTTNVIRLIPCHFIKFIDILFGSYDVEGKDGRNVQAI